MTSCSLVRHQLPFQKLLQTGKVVYSYDAGFPETFSVTKIILPILPMRFPLFNQIENENKIKKQQNKTLKKCKHLILCLRVLQFHRCFRLMGKNYTGNNWKYSFPPEFFSLLLMNSLHYGQATALRDVQWIAYLSFESYPAIIIL